MIGRWGIHGIRTKTAVVTFFLGALIALSIAMLIVGKVITGDRMDLAYHHANDVVGVTKQSNGADAAQLLDAGIPFDGDESRVRLLLEPLPGHLTASPSLSPSTTTIFTTPDGRTMALVEIGPSYPAFELVASTGEIIAASPSVRNAEDMAGGPLTPPPVGRQFQESAPVTFWRQSGGVDSVLDGHVVSAACSWTIDRGAADWDQASLASLRDLPASATVRACVFLDPFADLMDFSTRRNTVAAAGGVALLLTSVATLVTDRRMRPMERLRRQAAAAAAGDDPELLPVNGSGDELAAMTGTINDTIARLRAALEAQRQFVGNAAHELRSPLTVLINNLEIAEIYPQLADPEKVVATALHHARRLQALIQDLLLLAQLDARTPGLSQHVDLLALVTDLVAERRLTSRIPIELSAEPAAVVGDPVRLGRIVANLLDNAIRYAETTVRITVAPTEIAVSNDGPSIPREDAELIFNRFGRLDPDRARSSGGAGLGLAIARDLARRHGGDVVLDLTPGPSGATFRLILPPRIQQ